SSCCRKSRMRSHRAPVSTCEASHPPLLIRSPICGERNDLLSTLRTLAYRSALLQGCGDAASFLALAPRVGLRPTPNQEANSPPPYQEYPTTRPAHPRNSQAAIQHGFAYWKERRFRLLERKSVLHHTRVIPSRHGHIRFVAANPLGMSALRGRCTMDVEELFR